MNSKRIARHLKSKLDAWVNSVSDDVIKHTIKQNAIVTGGAIVSLLIGEEPKDYDIYFKTMGSCLAVAKYYAEQFTRDSDRTVEIKEQGGRITAFIQSAGVADEESDFDETDPFAEAEPKKKDKKPFRAKFFTTNAISLSDKIQLIIRFYGDVAEIHKNYDFAHCTCSYDYSTGEVALPEKALECIVNKELFYMGSKYPLCSIIRTRKFLSRGWHINAGQYLKMAFQLNTLDLNDPAVLADQLVGVDSAYFGAFINHMEQMKADKPDFVPDTEYFFEVINKIF